jgi:hypothetical protein
VDRRREDRDHAALDKLLIDDFLAVGPLGFTLNKREWLDRHERGLRYQTFGLQEVQVRRYGDMAVVVARQVGQGTYRGIRCPRRSVRR